MMTTYWEQHNREAYTRHTLFRQESVQLEVDMNDGPVYLLTNRLMCVVCEFPEPLRQYLFSTPIELTPITLPVEDLDEAKRLAEVSSLMEVSAYA